MFERAQKLNDVVYVELVRSLFATPLASLIMSFVFALAFALIGTRHFDALYVATGAAGLAASLARLVTVAWYRREALSEGLAPLRARLIERRFAVTYLAFALCLGMFGAHVFTLALAEAHVLAICVMVGYCAGAAAGVGLRPGIAIPSMLLAIGPTIVIAAMKGDALYLGMSVAAAALLAGGAQSVIARNRTMMIEIGKRVTFASLARQDGLTALPNRLGLREWFETEFALGPDGGAIAVHYLDLDGFKPVNDRYGHPVGDTLLQAVGERLSDALRAGDIAARLGGDEFAVIQIGLRRSEESELLAQRIAAALRRPFIIGGHVIEISTCIGTVIASDRRRDLEQLLMEADQALYRAKRRGQGSVEQGVAA